MTKANKWFTEVFLPSIEERATNPKYPNQVILSEKQADICFKYMEEEQCYNSDYRKFFLLWKIEVNGKMYCMDKRGKYTFLTWHKLTAPRKLDLLEDDIRAICFDTYEDLHYDLGSQKPDRETYKEMAEKMLREYNEEAGRPIKEDRINECIEIITDLHFED